MENELAKTSEGKSQLSNIELKVVCAETYSQHESEGELRMFVKKKVLETWEKLIYWQSVYLEEVRKGGGTMGHKVGSLRNQQIHLKELFESL